ncbi:MAG: VCBS repeat-containing protein [Planctomycetes bacterium]|nr:VCBS repeat-containing protein [Planctomycetota bacterium]
MRRIVVCLALAACGRETPPQPQPAPATGIAFTDITAACGVDFVHDAGKTEAKQLPETMGAGAAIVDVDEDGDLDLYFVQSGPLPIPGTQRAADRPTNRLFLNDGKAHFRDATKESGDGAQSNYGMGVVCGDANGDGHVDFYLTNLGPDALLFGDGKAHFRDATAQSGITGDEWTMGAAFLDADDDGDLDLFVATYVAIDLAHPLWCGERKPGWRSYCHPDAYPGLEDHFWKNNGDGTFVEATKVAGFSDPGGKGLGVAASDLDGDGFVDLYVANDSTENRFYRGKGDGTFEDATLRSGLGVDRFGRTEASMGIAIGDVDGDGKLDLFVTGFDDESDTLYLGLGSRGFDDRTVAAGLEAPTMLPVGFGCVLEDFDLDGDLDLAIANGHILDNIELYNDGKTHAQRALLFRNDGQGHFTSIDGGAFTASPFVGRGLYMGDLDGDGAPELVLTQCNGPARVFRAPHPGTPSLTLRGLPRNSRGGSRESGAQSSYLGQSADEIYLPLPAGPLQRLELAFPGRAGRQTIALDPPIADGVLVFRGEPGALRVEQRGR